MEFILGLTALFVGSVLSLTADTDQNVRVVNVVREHIGECEKHEVCADVFNFTRENEDGTSQLETRYIQNCECPGAPCGRTGSQLLFRETRVQSMVTCEEATEFKVCREGQVAKEQHQHDKYGLRVHFKLNCLCPNNENPSDFRRKMTTLKQFWKMSQEEKEYSEAFPGVRLYMCKGNSRF